MGMPPRGVDSLHVFLSQLCLQVQNRFPDRTTEWRWLMMAAFWKSATANHALRWFDVHVGTPLTALLRSTLGLLPVQLLGRASLKSSSWQIQCGCGGCGQTMGGTNGQAQHFKQRVPPHVASWQSFTNRSWDSHSSKSAPHCQLASAKSMQAAILATSSHKPYRNALSLVCRGGIQWCWNVAISECKSLGNMFLKAGVVVHREQDLNLAISLDKPGTATSFFSPWNLKF